MNINNYLNKALLFFSYKKTNYWNSITKCSISGKPEKLGKYYLDFSSKAEFKGKFSEEGIPLFDYPDFKQLEQPIVIAQYALGIYELLVKKNFNDEKLKNEFLILANWFEKNKNDHLDGKVWYIYSLYPKFGLKSPWISAMAQGEAISVLVRAAKLFNNEKFELLANEALTPFEYPVKKGGIINYFKTIPIYEEFPTPEKTSGVLNGMLFAIFGLYDLILINNKKASELFENGITSLKKLLPYYDLKYWSQYNLYKYPKKFPASFTYHLLVVEQLKALFYLSGEDIFYEYSKRWEECTKNFFYRNRVLFEKIFFANKIFLK